MSIKRSLPVQKSMQLTNINWWPSLLAADPLQFKEGLEKVRKAGLSGVHLDIMDGHFVPNISFGPSVVRAVTQNYPEVFRDVHLMLSHPEDFIPKFIESGAQSITIHIEIARDSLENSLRLLQAHSIPYGLAINPETPLEALTPFLDNFPHHVLVMSVHPGFSGQAFIPETYQRVQQLRQRYPKLPLCIDGGINSKIAQEFVPLGVKDFVVGASFFGAA